jgi:hypothetical protein
MTPPSHIIEAAVRAARQSPCAKSQRGVVVYSRSSGIDIASGFNGPPGRGVCARDDACREACGKICVHAEMRALRAARDILKRPEFNVLYMAECDAVHVKIGGGPVRGLVDGGGPSCWQCSREVVDVGLGGFWLYETARCVCPAACGSHRHPGEDGCTCSMHGTGEGGALALGRWRRYNGIEFHAATLLACGLPPLVG